MVKKLVSVFIVVLLATALTVQPFLGVSGGGLQSVSAATPSQTTVSGEISLPAGVVAPVGGLVVHVRASRMVMYGGFQVVAESDVAIPAGQRSTAFALTVPTGVNVIVSYSLTNPVVGLAQVGWHAGEGTVINRNRASWLTVDSAPLEGVNMELVALVTLSGRISLPAGVVAPSSGVPVQVNVRIDGLHFGDVYVMVNIPSGESVVSYELDVPQGSMVRIWYRLMFEVAGLAEAGWYHAARTVNDHHQAQVVDIRSAAITDKNITMLALVRVAGHVMLPAGITAPIGGMKLWIETRQRRTTAFLGSSSVTIPSGESSVAYEIFAPQNDSVVLRYFFPDGDLQQMGIILDGWYHSAGSVISLNDAEGIDVSTAPITGVNIAVLSAAKVSGRIVLPPGVVAPSSGVRGQIEVISYPSWRRMRGAAFYIPNGQSEASYHIWVPHGTSLRLGYIINEGYANVGAQLGWYREGGLVVDVHQAQVIRIERAHLTNVNLAVQPLVRVSGKITLPKGITAPSGGMVVRVRADIDPPLADVRFVFESSAIIPEGQSVATYQIYVPANCDFWLDFELPKDAASAAGLIYFGWYHEAGIVGERARGQVQRIDRDPLTGVDIAVLHISADTERPVVFTNAPSTTTEERIDVHLTATDNFAVTSFASADRYSDRMRGTTFVAFLRLPLVVGVNTFVVQVGDAAGNVTSHIITINREARPAPPADTAPPDIEIAAPAVTTEATAVVTVTVRDNVAIAANGITFGGTVVLGLAGGEQVFTRNVTLREGMNVFNVSAQDVAGNVTNGTVAIERRTPPVPANHVISIGRANPAIGLDVPANVRNGRLMVPLRWFGEQILDAVVDFKVVGTAEIVTLVKGNITVELTLNSTIARVNGNTVSLDVAAFATGGRTLVPARFLAETFGYTVNWNPADDSVTITKR